MSLANEDKKVGAVLGMDIPDINDFVGSFCQACIDAGVQVKIVYCNSFSDPNAGYLSAMEFYNDGCDVVWQVAGSAGIGVFRASIEAGRYAFGVDVGQVLISTHVELFSHQNRLFQISHFQFFLSQVSLNSKIVVPTFSGYLQLKTQTPFCNFLESNGDE